MVKVHCWVQTTNLVAARYLTPKLSHLNLNLDRLHISTDKNPDKDLTQKPPYATFAHVYVVTAGQAGPQFE